ncbi:MAG: PadR family transcriptional regulator [Nocardioides sp.]
MALEHALLVALSEEPAAGSDLARRFDRSIGFFWSATHQQIYRTLARMTTDGWLSVTTVAQAGTPARRVCDVSPAGRRQLTRWLAAPTPVDPLRSELAVKLRAASRGDTTALRGIVKEHLADHTVRDYLAGRTPTEATR